MITKKDITDKALQMGVVLTATEFIWIASCYEDAQRQDPSGTWDLVVEDLIHQCLEIRAKNRVDNSMTKDQAIQAMREGKKVTHNYFSPDEWMTMEHGLILLEDGVKCSEDEFWRWRMTADWENGWELYFPA